MAYSLGRGHLVLPLVALGHDERTRDHDQQDGETRGAKYEKLFEFAS